MVLKESLNNWVVRAYDIACSHGFHDVKRSDAHYMMLVLSEVGEMVEADRKNRHAFVGDKLDISSTDFAEWFEKNIKDTLEDELADVCIRLFDFAGVKHWTFDGFPDDMKQDFDNLFGSMSLCERAFSLSTLVVDGIRTTNDDEMCNNIACALCFCFCLADDLVIDLAWHIDAKMEYNDSREKRHGKNY